MIFKLIGLACLASMPLHASGYGFVPLRSNGAVFVAGGQRLPLRCLDAEGLLDMTADQQDALLDKAAAAGFNSITFAAPVFGPGSFCETLGSIDTARVAAFRELLAAMEERSLYAFPVLWDASAVAAFEKIGKGAEYFFAGRVQNEWQAWLTRKLIESGGEGACLSSTAAVGGWILYRGPWPGPQTRATAVSDTTGTGPQAFTAPLRNWLLWQMRALRRSGAVQLAGMGFLLHGDLGQKMVQDDPALDKPDSIPPLSPLQSGETVVPDDASMDSLPPVPGGEKVDGTSDAPMTPWDLEGVDWDSVGQAMKEIPVTTGISFMELTLDTEDWFSIGDAMASVEKQDMQVPLLWRQDWRTASRYERQKHLEAPDGLAGLAGSWPDNDWPDSGESIWPTEESGKTYDTALEFKYMEVLKVDEKPVLVLHLNRVCGVQLDWGRRWPLNRHSSSSELALVHKLGLRGAKFGDSILICARATSTRFGGAVLSCRWVRLTLPPPSKDDTKSQN